MATEKKIIDPLVNSMAAAVEPAAAAEEQPARGGSYVRNPDGTLTQTEGHGFAQDNFKPNQE